MEITPQATYGSIGTIPAMRIALRPSVNASVTSREISTSCGTTDTNASADTQQEGVH